MQKQLGSPQERVILRLLVCNDNERCHFVDAVSGQDLLRDH